MSNLSRNELALARRAADAAANAARDHLCRTRSNDDAFMEMLHEDASLWNSVREALEEGDLCWAAGTAGLMETGCRDHMDVVTVRAEREALAKALGWTLLR